MRFEILKRILAMNAAANAVTIIVAIAMLSSASILPAACSQGVSANDEKENRTSVGPGLEEGNSAQQTDDGGPEIYCDDRFVGLVKQGAFQLLWPRSGVGIRLTGIAMQEARTPESLELNLSAYEDMVIIVEGHDGGGWIYSARVIDQAGPINCSSSWGDLG